MALWPPPPPRRKRHGLLWGAVFLALLVRAHADFVGKDFLRDAVPLQDAVRLAVPLYRRQHSAFSVNSSTVFRQADVLPRFTSGPTLGSNQIAMIDGLASENVFFLFTPEENKTAADYDFTMTSSNGLVGGPEHFKVEQVQTVTGGFNVSATVDFEQWVGQTDLTFSATEKSSRSVTTSSAQTATVYGMSCFRTLTNGTRVLVGGPNFPLNLTTAEVREQSTVDLGCFVQYGDGTDSSESLNAKYPVSGIAISDSGVGDREITHNSATCPDTGNTFNGTSVTLQSGCAYGMSDNDVNGQYVGPQFGLGLNRNRNGSFDINFDWGSLLAGSSLEAAGYEMTINVNVEGETNPIVTSISPTGPFGSTGNDTVDVVVENLPADVEVAKSWSYGLAIRFPDGSQRPATLVEDGVKTNSENKTATLTFQLPEGTGSDLPWTLTATKPDGTALPADDQTSPSYLFTFEELVRLGSISPSSGPESGGLNITLSGQFPGFDTSNSGVYFDGTIIPSTSIIGFDETTVNFTLPEKIGENFNKTVTVQIDGRTSNGLTFTYNPETTLTKISPAFGPAEGNTTVTLTGQFIGFDKADASQSGIFFGDKQLDMSLVSNVSDTSLVFSTPPKTTFGDDSNFGYNVTVKIGDEVSDPLQFTYQAPVSITSISPATGPEAGGTEVTLTGDFATFSAAGSAVFIGGQKVDSSNIISSSATEIKFRSPPRSSVGSSHDYDVWVVALEVQSNSVKYTYGAASAGLSIIASGGNFDDGAGKYFIGACGNTDYRAFLTPGARSQNPTYRWTLVDVASGASILDGKGIVTDEELLILPYTIFPSKNTDYLLSITISTDFITEETTTYTLVQRDVQSIGVRIIDPRPRSISDPNITLTIPSVISLPGCSNTDLKIDNTSMTYIWEYRSKSYLFSYLNNSAPEGQVGPTLLGREFQVPQTAMAYGSFTVRLTAYFTEFTNIRGTDVATLVVQPEPLVAQINGGEDSQFISESNDFAMTGAKSRDPDVLVGDDSEGLTYEWQCMHSTDPTFATNTTCSDALLPSISSVSFSVSQAGLSLIRNSEELTYLQYSLTVKKSSENENGNTISRVSSTASTVLVISEQASQRYDALDNIFIRNNLTAAVDRTAVKYFEDVIITPVSATEDTIWEFELVEPEHQASLLNDPTNLIPFAGYYSLGLRAGRYSLGILANKLTPNTKYTFRILTYRTNFERNEQTVSFRTAERPVVTIGSLPVTTGTTNSTFYVSASTNYDSDFKFYIIVTDEFGLEYCVDGCQGVPVARFRLASQGTYGVRCEVYDSLGYTRLANATSSTNITVQPPATPFTATEMARQSEIAFEAGDHALYQQLSNDFVKNVFEDSWASDPTLHSTVVTNITLKVAHMVANSIPNTLQSSSYVRTAASIARLSPTKGITLNTSTLYQLLNITELAVTRTPDNAALQQLDDILEFYGLAPSLILQTYNNGSDLIFTSRQAGGSGSTGRNADDMVIILADAFELMKKQVMQVAMKNSLCGSRLTVNSGKASASGRALAMRHARASEPNVFSAQGNDTTEARVNKTMNPTQELLIPSSFQVAKICNPEQGLELFIDENTDQEIRFKTCSGIFNDRFRNLVFIVSNTPDYVWLSKIQDLQTRIRGLVSVGVAELTPENELVPLLYTEDKCYEVEMPLLTSGNMSELVSRENAAVPGLRFAPPRKFGDPMDNIDSYYKTDRKGVTARTLKKKLPDGSKSSIRAKIVASNTGIFTVPAIDFDSLFSLEGLKWTLYIILGLLLLTALLIVIVGTIAYRYTAAGAPPPIEAAPVDTEFTYVERDIYGRGTAVDMMEPDGALSPAAAAAAGAAVAAAAARGGGSADSAAEGLQTGAEESRMPEIEDEVEAENPLER